MASVASSVLVWARVIGLGDRGPDDLRCGFEIINVLCGLLREVSRSKEEAWRAGDVWWNEAARFADEVLMLALCLSVREGFRCRMRCPVVEGLTGRFGG